MDTILVTGATGHFGKSTIEFLLKKGFPAENIVALVRDESKASDLKQKGITVKVGDYDDYTSLLTAFKGVDKVLLVSGNDVEKRAKQQEDVVKAAKEAGVKHILYTSFERKNETATSPILFVAASHLSTEQHIKASGIAFTILRNNLYIDLLPGFVGEKVLEKGVFFPAGDAKTAFVLRSDMAEATANILTQEGHENKTYSFSNVEKVSFEEIAQWIGEASGKEVAYLNPSQEVYKDVLSKAGVPAVFIAIFAGFAEGIKQGEFDVTSTDLENILGRKPATVGAFIKGVYSTK